MKISYYPGCTLRTKAKELDESARLCAKALGVEMEEVENWQCCGAVYPMGTDEIATKLSAVRALDWAKHHGGKLLTLCSACHNVIKRTNEDMKTNEDICFRANNYLKLQNRLKVLSQKSIREKILFYLEQKTEHKHTNKIYIHSKKELAEYLNIPRPSLSRELIKLQEENIISFNKHYIILNSKNSLR